MPPWWISIFYEFVTNSNRLLKKASRSVIARSVSDEAISYLIEMLNYEFAKFIPSE